jgi:hypothetical protein
VRAAEDEGGGLAAEEAAVLALLRGRAGRANGRAAG